MRTCLIFFVLILLSNVRVIAQTDSICVFNVLELSQLKDNQYEILSIDFNLKRNFDYSLIPRGVKTLRFLRPSRNLVQAGVLYERIAELEKIELQGRMIEFLPEILYICKNLNIVILTDSKLSIIWKYTTLIENRRIALLILKNFRIDEKCNMYKGIFKGGDFQVEKILLESNKQVSAEEQTLLMNVFNTRDLWVNGTAQYIYPK